MAADPAVIATAIGAGLGGLTMATLAFVKVFKSEKATKARDSEILDALTIIKDIFGKGPTNGDGKPFRSDGIPGFAPECLRRATEHGERLATAEGDIRNINSKFVDHAARFDGLNGKIETVRKEMKQEFADFKEDIGERFTELKQSIEQSR